MVARGRRVGDVTVVVESPDGWDQAGLKWLVSQAIASPGVVAALCSAGAPHAAVIGRSPGVAADADALLKTLIGQFGGKGGGRPDLAQGGGLAGPADAIRSAALAAIERSLGAA
jgi:alanyl-tRNA synthetase